MNEPCRVCGEPTTEHSNATCNACGGTFHLALRIDVPAPDCGQVWINEEYLALEFACNACLTLEQGAPTHSAPPAQAAPMPAPRRYARREGTSAAQLLRAKRRRR